MKRLATKQVHLISVQISVPPPPFTVAFHQALFSSAVRASGRLRHRGPARSHAGEESRVVPPSTEDPGRDYPGR